MFGPDLLTSCQLTMPAAETTSAGTAVNGTAVDMQGYDGVIFVARINTANAGNFLKAQHGDLANGSDAVDLAGTKVVTIADGNLAILDVVCPAKGATVGPRYIRPVIIRAGANTVTGPIIAIRYNASKKPTVNTVASVADAKTVISPAEGTP